VKATKKLLLGLFCLIPVSTFAGGNLGWMTVDNIVQRECQQPNQAFEITFTAPHVNPDVCFNSKTVQVNCDHPLYNQMMAIALTAQAAGSELSGYVHECDSDGHAMLRSIKIR
jgi:hypothetical protein